MRAVLIGVLAIAATTVAIAQPIQRNGYVRKDGTYVAPSYSSRPNGTKLDNYSTKGNVNPYTGRVGTVDPYAAPSYGSSYGSSYSAPAKRKSSSPY